MNFQSCGTDVYISPLAVIRRPELAQLGNHLSIDEYVVISTALELADFVHIAPFVSCVGGAQALLKMGHFTTIAAGSRIICGTDGYLGEGLIHPRVPEEYQDIKKIAPVTFGDFAIVATNVVVLPGVTLGEGSVVGACSLVTEDIEPWCIAWGVPAKPRKIRKSSQIKQYAREMGYP